MAANADNDVVIVESNSELFAGLSDYEDKPLMMLFKRLIGNDSKQNTVLTNAQIIEILQKEFNMDILYIHELEVDIYLNTLKKFLKDWPQWDEFDSAINSLKHQKNYDKIKSMLECNYESLKSYLQHTLKSVEPLLRENIKAVKKATLKEDSIEDDVVMELQCTRQQLNRLFFRRPHPYFNNTIFNNQMPSKIRVNSFPLHSMLNWPNIRISINLNGSLLFRRDLTLALKHVLVNKKLNYSKKPPEVLKTNFQMRGSKLASMDLESVNQILDKIYSTMYVDSDLQQVIQSVSTLLKSDIENGPRSLQCPITYRRNLSESTYVRYLYSEVNTNATFNVNNYDLQLEEKAQPQILLNFSRFPKQNENTDIPSDGRFLAIHCMLCGSKFSGTDILVKMKEHFEEYHNDEFDWECTRCKLIFSMDYLAKMKWRHMCEPSENDSD